MGSPPTMLDRIALYARDAGVQGRTEGLPPIKEVRLHPDVYAQLREEAETVCTFETPSWQPLAAYGCTIVSDPRVPPNFIVPLREGETFEDVLARWLRALVGDVPAVDGTDLRA